MGADGGTVPTRSEQVKQKRKEERLDAVGRAQLRLNFCALSGQPLSKSPANIVCDSHGSLFNLESVLEHLLDAQKKLILKDSFGIRKMKDVIKIKAEMNDAYVTSTDSGEVFVAPFRCPFTGHVSNGVIKFMVLRTCGHVISQRALHELASIPTTGSTSLVQTSAPSSEPPPSIASTSHQCLVCQKPYLPDQDMIEMAADPLSLAPKDNLAERKEKKRPHSHALQPEATASPTDPVEPPSPKRPKLA